MEFIYQPFNVFIESPLLALLPTALFGAIFTRTLLRHQRRWSLSALAQFLAAILWLGYTGWELYTSHAVPLESVPIRIDLMFIAPVLWIVSGVALLTWILQSMRNAARQQTTPVADRLEPQPTPASADERLAHLVKKPKDEQKS